jgi:hypothetical protein
MSTGVVYVSKVRIVRQKGALRRAWLPVEKDPIFFGIHSDIAKHYKADPSKIEPHAATLDYLVASAAG